MNKTSLLKKLDDTWQQFLASYSGFTDAQMVQPGVTGEWSVKDIIAHVTTWEEEALKSLPLLIQGLRPPRYKDLYGGLDAFNALMTEKKRSHLLSEILMQSKAVHQHLIAFIKDIPEEYFAIETPIRRRLRLDTYSHYPIHARAILAWRELSE